MGPMGVNWSCLWIDGVAEKSVEKSGSFQLAHSHVDGQATPVPAIIHPQPVRATSSQSVKSVSCSPKS